MMFHSAENGIHTAVDTAGNIPWADFEKIIPYTDLFLYDIKLFDREKHKQYTGADNKVILDNLKKLFECGASVWIRIPIIPGVNDTEEEMRKIKEFLKPYSPLKIELLCYHKMGEHKYDALNMQITKFSVPDKTILDKLNYIFKEGN